MSDMFQGFRRRDGRVGVRNHLLIMSVTGLTGPTTRRIAGAIAGARLVSTPFGSGLLGEDEVVQTRSLTGFGKHPNVGATLVIGANAPQVHAIAEDIARSGIPVEALVFDDCGH